MKKVMTILCLLFVSNVIYAQKTYGVIVGISDYKYAGYDSGDLIYADKDADKMYALLNPSNTPNFVLLKNSNATKSRILRALHQTFSQAGPNDMLIFYFSGHGVQNSFVQYEANKNSELLLHKEITEVFKNFKAKTKVIIADACFSGSLAPAINKKQRAVSNDIQVLRMLSSRRSQFSKEDITGKGGVFTYLLVNGLRGEADLNKNREVTVRELYLYIKPRLAKLTDNEQSPRFEGQFSNTWVLSRY